MKFSATFEEKVKKAEEQGDRPLVSSYLNPSKVDPYLLLIQPLKK